MFPFWDMSEGGELGQLHNPALVDEDERLEQLNIETKSWYEWMVEIDTIRAAQ